MKEQKPKAVAYYRVSTLLLGQTIENQSVPIREYCRNRGFDLVSEFADEGVSGAKERRPALDKLMREARAGRFKVLIVARLDRLGRNVAHLLTVLNELHALGISFISLAEGFDATTPQGQLTMTILAAVAQMERELVRARVREALAAKKAIAAATGNGWRCGRPKVATDEVIEQVTQLHGRGLSHRAIEQALNKKVSRATITRILQGRFKTHNKSSSQVIEITEAKNIENGGPKQFGFEPKAKPGRR